MFNLFRNFRRAKVWIAVYAIERGDGWSPSEARILANHAVECIK